MLINDFLELVMRVPPMLAAGWGAWFLTGLLLSIWGRREKGFTVVHKSDEHKSGVRAAAGTKPPSGVRAPVKPSKNVPATEGDPFGDLEKLLDEQTGTHRMPGEAASPVLTDMTVTRSNGAALTAPQSLP